MLSGLIWWGYKRLQLMLGQIEVLQQRLLDAEKQYGADKEKIRLEQIEELKRVNETNQRTMESLTAALEANVK